MTGKEWCPEKKGGPEKRGGHSCFQWILTNYGIIIKNPIGGVATL